jgi:hypothetical protein
MNNEEVEYKLLEVKELLNNSMEEIQNETDSDLKQKLVNIANYYANVQFELTKEIIKRKSETNVSD